MNKFHYITLAFFAFLAITSFNHKAIADDNGQYVEEEYDNSDVSYDAEEEFDNTLYE